MTVFYTRVVGGIRIVECIRIVGCVLFCLAGCVPGYAQEGKPPVIADSLRWGADIVRQVDETELTIISPRKATIRYRRVYTILTPAGDTYSTITTYYDKFHDLNTFTAALYDANGKVLKKIRKGDMEDWSAEGAGILLVDARVKRYHFVCHSYPYTISYEEEMDINSLFNLPEWHPQTASDIAVVNSRLLVKTPTGYGLRYRQYHYPGDPVVTESGGRKTYTWELQNRTALSPEPYAPSWYRQETRVSLAAGDFEMNGYKGSLYTWTDMGRFLCSLYQGRDQLPEEARRKIHALTDGLKDDHEKIAVLYDFLQKNTHYVAIELGIGGWQPFDAAYVYNQRYGDCKALSNYMVAMLKEVGIRADNVIIRAGYEDPAIDTGFTCNRFNHNLVLAFAGQDSVWLECTSPILPPGYLSGFTADRDALLIRDNGGMLVHTPAYGVRQNRLERTMTGVLDENGGLRASLYNVYMGQEQDALQSMLDHLSKKEMLDQRQQSVGIQGCSVSNLEYRPTRTALPVIKESLQLSADHYATVSGNRLFITPGYFFRRANSLTEAPDARRNDVELTGSFEEVDSVVLQLPPGYVPETSLLSRTVSGPFGAYRIHSEMQGQTLTIICRYRQIKGLYPAAVYPRLVGFFNTIHREGIAQLVFVKK